MKGFQRILLGVHARFLQRNKQGRIAALAKRDPTYAAFLKVLTKGDATGIRGHPWRALDIEKALKLLAPKRIVELGSGTSTGIFASFVNRRAEASLVSVDESEHWVGLTRSGLEAVGFLPHPRIELIAAPRIDGKRGSHYAFQIEQDVDFVYVDGPSVSKRDGEKTPNEDVLLAFDTGRLPHAIFIDGRIDTVEAIRRHPAARDYVFTPGLQYLQAMQSTTDNAIVLSLAFHRHCLFVHRSGAS